MKKTEKHIQLTALELNTGQIEWLPKNPRQWTKDDLDLMIKSLEEDPDYMDDRPPLVTPIPSKPGFFAAFAGNLRVFTAKKMKDFSELKCIVYLPEDENDKVTIIRRAMKDNGHFGNWDNDILANEWDCFPLQQWGVPIPWTENQEEKKEAKEDDFDVSKDCIEVRCKPGDIWQLGEHRLMCGDSIKLEDVKKLMGGGTIADIAFSSPPYNAGFGANLTKKNGRSKYTNGKDDDLTTDDYSSFLRSYIHNANEFSKYNFVNIQMLANNKIAMFDALTHNLSRLADVLIWDKTRSQPAAAENVLNSEFEFIFCFSEKANRAIGTIPFHGTLKNIVHIAPGHNDFSDIHNAVFPVDLPAHFISNFAKDSVLDLFGGTGTTLIAAEQLGRKAYLMELDPHYCDVILARWEKLTGKIAMKIN